MVTLGWAGFRRCRGRHNNLPRTAKVYSGTPSLTWAQSMRRVPLSSKMRPWKRNKLPTLMGEHRDILAGEKVRIIESGRKGKVLQVAELPGYLENCTAADLKAAATPGIARTGAVFQFDPEDHETTAICGCEHETIHQGRLRGIIHLNARGQERSVAPLDSHIQIDKHIGG